MWIIQEVLMAKSLVIHCGTKLLEFSNFEQIVLAEFHSFRYLPNDSVIFSTQVNLLLQGLTGMLYTNGQRADSTLAGLISKYAFGQCADKHDLVYSLLPLVKYHRGKTPPPVDYTITPAELIQRCTLYMSPLDDVVAGEGVRHLRNCLGISPSEDLGSIQHQKDQ